MHGARPGGALRLLELGKARPQFILLSDHCHSCWSLHILSWGAQLGFVLSLIAFGRQWNTLESACSCQHFVLPQDLGETEAAGMWLEAHQLTRGSGILGQQGSPFLQQLGEAGPGFPRKGSVVTCMYLDIYMGR